MKTVIGVLVFTVAAWNSSGQGMVSFQNSVAFQTVDPTGGAHLVYSCFPFVPGPAGNGFTGTQYVAELYVGADAGSLAPLTASISRFRANTSINRGKWAATGVNGPNDFINTGFGVGAIITLQVKVWDFSMSATYEGSSGFSGASAPFTYKTVPSNDTTITDFYMEGFQAFGPLTPCVPEPSAVALGLVGLCSAWLFRRRRCRSEPRHPECRGLM